MNLRLVLLHGFLEDRTMWEPITSLLSLRRVRVDTPELPGHGERHALLAEISAEAYAHDVVQQLALNDDETFFLIGHSMGGYIASSIAALYPQRIAGMLLFHSKAGADDAQKKADRLRAIEAVQQNKALYVRTMITNTFHPDNRERLKNRIDKLVERAVKMDAEAIAAAQRVMIDRPDRVAAMQQRAFPLFYYLGADDTSIPLHVALQEIEQLPGAMYHITSEAAHMGQWESAQDAAQFIQRIIR